MSRFCAICKTKSHVCLLRFPTDINLRNLWIERTGVRPRSEKDISTRICNIHFLEEDWKYHLSSEHKIVKTLDYRAVPSLYIGDQAPDPHPDNYVPKTKPSKNVNCAVCNMRCPATDCITIYDRNDFYTDFGVVLTMVLSLSSRVLMSRYACGKCSNATLRCFEAMVDLNISTILTTRVQRLKSDLDAQAGQKLFYADEYDPKNSDDIRDLAKKNIQDLEELGISGRCPKCCTMFSSMEKYTDHFLTHLFIENREVYRRMVAMTQTSEVEMEMGANDIFKDFRDSGDEEEFPKTEPKCRRRNRKIKPQKNACLDTSFDDSTVADEYKVEFLDEEFFENVESIEKSIRSQPANNAKLSNTVVSVGSEIVPSFDVGNVIKQRRDMDCTDCCTVEVLEDEIGVDELTRPEPMAATSEFNDKFDVDTDVDIIDLPLKPLSETPSQTPWSRRKKKIQTGTQTGKRVCHVCGAVLKHMKSYMAHILIHEQPKKNFKTCDSCGKLCGNLSQHRKTCARQLERIANGAKDRKSPTATCGVCGKTLCEQYLARHLQNHEIEEEVAREGTSAMEKYMQPCEMCGKRVKHLQSHMKKTHNIKITIESNCADPPGTFECEHCGAFFLQRPMFVIHLVLKHGLDPRLLNSRGSWGYKAQWICSVCTGTFYTYNAIKKHTHEAHNGIGIDLECELCGKRYNCLRSLRSHINIKHINYYKFHCIPCDMYFVKPESYREHQSFRCRANLSGRKRGRKGDGEYSKRKKTEKFFIPSFNETVIADDEVFYITEYGTDNPL